MALGNKELKWEHHWTDEETLVFTDRATRTEFACVEFYEGGIELTEVGVFAAGERLLGPEKCESLKEAHSVVAELHELRFGGE